MSRNIVNQGDYSISDEIFMKFIDVLENKAAVQLKLDQANQKEILEK